VNAPDLLGARALRELLASRDVRPKKRYGQNFVVDPNTIRKVLDVAALRPDAHVLEVGAGVGSLTLGLVATGARVTAIEVDERLLPLLERSVARYDNVEIVQGDAMKMEPERLAADAVVANLPYNLAASIVLRLLMEVPAIQSLTVMAQREVGERLTARPGSKVYGQTSVLVAFYARAEVAAPITRRAFYPVPDVDSVLVRIDRRGTPQVDPQTFHRIVRAAFAQRRKTLRNSLASLAPDMASLFERAGIAPDARAESVGLEGFVALTEAISQ
jgi:16S rRNA (adenine1518-N6/adenine1519-N6)-dimethyltransferase